MIGRLDLSKLSGGKISYFTFTSFSDEIVHSLDNFVHADVEKKKKKRE